MQLKKFFFITALACQFSYAYATDINIVNNTDAFGTGKVNSSPCSSSLGEKGIIKPHSSLGVPLSIFNLFCIGSCTANVYLSKNCSGTPLAQVSIDKHSGVTSVTNFDKEHYIINGAGTNLSLEAVPNSLTSWFKSLIG